MSVRVPHELRPGERAPYCSNEVPIIDTVYAVAGVGAGGVGTIAIFGDDSTEEAGQGLIMSLPVLALGVLATASAVYGYRAIARCRRLARDQRVNERTTPAPAPVQERP